MSGSWAVTRLETRFRALHDGRVSYHIGCIRSG